MTFKRKHVKLVVCPIDGCQNKVPSIYDGRPGVSLSRFTQGLIICSTCGTREALGGKPLMLKPKEAVS